MQTIEEYIATLKLPPKQAARRHRELYAALNLTPPRLSLATSNAPIHKASFASASPFPPRKPTFLRVRLYLLLWKLWLILACGRFFRMDSLMLTFLRRGAE